jgi:putative tryptophan/tyrosine transport system substrate-binding protein
VIKGALAAYGESFYTIGRLSAKYVQHVLLGANPGELPVEQVDRLHLVINLKTARALGLAIPEPVLARADELIERRSATGPPRMRLRTLPATAPGGG